MIAKCKVFSITVSGNNPSAKITTLPEAVTYLKSIPGSAQRLLIRFSVESLLSHLILLGGLATIFVTARMVIAAYSPLYFWDSWQIVFAAVHGERLLSWHWLWAQHNEHRMVLPNLFFIADLAWFRGRQGFLLATIFIIQSLHLALLAWSMAVFGALRGATWRTGAGIAAFCLFCPSQWENFVWGFQIGFVLPPLLATLSFFALLSYSAKHRDQPNKWNWLWLLLSIAAAVSCSWSVANGVLVWPILTLASALLLTMRQVSLYAVAGSLCTWYYFSGFVAGREAGDSLQRALLSPLSLVEFETTYLGSAWVWKSIYGAMAIGVIALLMSLAFVCRARVYSRNLQLFEIQLLMILSFCIGTAFLTSIGRINLGLEHAFTSHYQTNVLLFWWALRMLLLTRLFADKHSQSNAVLAQLLILVMFLAAALLLPRPIHEVKYRQFIVDRATAALLMNVNDPEALRYVYPDAGEAWDGAQYLRTKYLSIFSDPIKVDQQLGSFATSTECRGGAELIVLPHRLLGALRISGWAWNSRDGRPVDKVISSRNGIVSGRFAVGAWLPAVRAAHRGINNSYIGFEGYVPENETRAKITLYAILPSNPPTACPFATIDPLNVVKEAR